MDHPFTSWLLENAVKLKLYFERQFQQLIEYFCQKDAEDIIHIYNVIHDLHDTVKAENVTCTFPQSPPQFPAASYFRKAE